MVSTVSKFLVVPVIALLIVMSMSYSDLRFQTSSPRLLSEAEMKDIGKISYAQYYQIKAPIKFLVNVNTPDKKTEASLLWPDAPYQKIFLLDSTTHQNFPQNDSYFGQIVRCSYMCQPQGLTIEIESFINMIYNRLPEFKEKSELMPTMILNTFVKPQGIKAYLEQYRWHYVGVIITTILSIIGGVIVGLKRN